MLYYRLILDCLLCNILIEQTLSFRKKKSILELVVYEGWEWVHSPLLGNFSFKFIGFGARIPNSHGSGRFWS